MIAITAPANIQPTKAEASITTLLAVLRVAAGLFESSVIGRTLLIERCSGFAELLPDIVV